MKNTFLMANLTSMRLIDVAVFTDVPIPNNSYFILYKDEKKIGALKILKRRANNAIYYFQLELNEDYDFSKRYYLLLNNFPMFQVNVTNAIDFPNFDEMFNYDGDDLGNTYSKEETSFAVWAPLATAVYLKMVSPDNKIDMYTMERHEKGVYRFVLKGDYKNYRYHYLVENNGIRRECNDIYAKGVSLRSEYSTIIDLEEVKNLGKVKPTYPYKNPVDAIIYETSIRDFTEGEGTDIVNKGKYLGMVEENRKTKGNHPAGLDYLKLLGITHLQILPVIDFYTVDDDNVKAKYNWGYDPISFFNLEGSYSSSPEDATSRLIEFKTMVNKLHENDIRVVMDVVYNHLYEHHQTAFDATIPNYYFRIRKNGEISMVSGCGNDFASERYMARKLIVDSCKYFVDMFDVDGYRFDLMGLLDIKTINTLKDEIKKIKDDVIIYGEGWNMINELPTEVKAMSDNSFKMPEIGFFNDTYREIVKGPTFQDRLYVKGFTGGDLNYRFGFDFVFHGSCLNRTYNQKFLTANQSINYIECHDNGTLFDKFSASNPSDNEYEILDRVKLANAIVVLSLGVPFIHMGQEIGLSKDGLDNTYNVKKINQMNWKLVDERFEMVIDLAHLIKARKYKYNFLKLYDPKDIDGKFTNWLHQDACYIISSKDVLINNRPSELIMIFNLTERNCIYSIGDYYILDNSANTEDIHINNALVARLNYMVLYKYKDGK